jgi:acetyl-CoA C-acetyltransferase
MCQRLRERPGSRGLVTGNGWYLTKHSAAVLASAPSAAPARPAPACALPPPLLVLEDANGPATVETYTVLYGRESEPVRGIVVGRLDESGRRFLANTPDDRGLLEALVATEVVGRRGAVRSVDGTNRFTPV